MAHMPSDETPGGFDEMASSRILGRVTAGTGVVEELTGTQAATLIDTFTSALKGLVPPSGGGVLNYLRADGSWSAPAGGGGGGGGGGIYYNVLDYGLVADGVTDNKAAFSTLVDSVIAAGGGTIYFPAAALPYHFAIGGPGQRDVKRISGSSSAIKIMNLRILGDGRASTLTWGGDAGGADSHFMVFEEGCKYFTAESFCLKQKDAIVNPDSAEQHHGFKLEATTWGNVEYFRFINMDFGLIKGDMINAVGGFNQSACVSDANGYAATLPAGAMAGPFTPPLEPQRVCVDYPDNLTSGNTNTTVNAVAKTYTRTSGSFITNGFAVGQTVTWSGFANGGNNVTDTIAVLTATVMTVTGGGSLVDESGSGNEVCVGPEWDGGAFTITGTNRQNVAISETIPAGQNDRFASVLEFKTVTGVEKLGGAGLCTGKVTIGYVFMSRYILVQGCRFNGYDAAGTPPDYGYRSAIGVQRLCGYIYVNGCFFTGSSDQLIDFEPTGNGNLGPIVVEGNMFIASSPKSGTGDGGLAVTFYGNGNTPDGGSLLLESSSFSGNYVYGRVSCGKLSACMVNDNVIVCDNSDNNYGVLTFIDTSNDVEIRGNKIYTKPTTISLPVKISGATPWHPNGVRFVDNTIHWYDLVGLRIEGGLNIDVRGNRLVYLGADTNTDIGILYQATADTPERIVIADNVFEGARGGGTLQYAVQYNPGDVNIAVLHMVGNKGTGCQTGGIRIVTPGGGAYTAPPTVYGNNFPDATASVVLGAGVGVMCGGNEGEFALYTGPEISPNNLTMLDAAAIGSLYRGQGTGAVLYRKLTAGATGWVSTFTSMGAIRGCHMVYATAATVQISTGTIADVDGRGTMILAATKTANIANAGANGLDTGTEANSTWYALWAIGKLDGTTASLLSLSATAPTMPTDYVLKRRVGWVRNNSAGNFLKFYQCGSGTDRTVYYDEDQANLVALNDGSATTWTNVDLSAWVPTDDICVILIVDLTGAAGGAADAAWLRPDGATSADGPYGVHGDFSAAAGATRNHITMPQGANCIVEYMVTDLNDDLDLLVLGYIDEL